VLLSWHVCVVLSCYFLCKVYIDSNLVTSSNMVMLVRCYHYVEVSFHYVHIRFMIIFNYDYLVVEIDDTKKWLIKLSCMLSICC
jgi:hypothetical protein